MIRRLAIAVAGLALVLGLASCGSGTPTGTATGAQAVPSGGTQGAQAPQFPGARGLIAEASGTTLQVQGSGTQTAVSYAASTTLFKVVPGTLKDVTAGVCVTVRRAETASRDTATSAPTGAVAAGSISVSQPVNGTCTFGIAGAGGRPGGGGGNRTFTGRPGGFPSGGPTGAGGFARQFGVTGKVLSVDGASFTVQPDVPGSGGATATPTSTPESVTTTAQTTVTTTRRAVAGDITVGECVTAIGTADDTGAITARTMVLQSAVNGQCGLSGFGRGAGAPNGTGQ